MNIQNVINLSRAGISTLVNSETGIATTRFGGARLSWGPSLMDGDGNRTEPNGYDWARYGSGGEIEAQDWAATDEDMAAVLSDFTGA